MHNQFLIHLKKKHKMFLLDTENLKQKEIVLFK